MNAWIDDEFATLDLNDLRLDRRARMILARFASKPSLSIPAACDGQEAEREAAYRFFANDKVDDFEILRAHRLASIQRMATLPVVESQVGPKSTWRPLLLASEKDSTPVLAWVPTDAVVVVADPNAVFFDELPEPTTIPAITPRTMTTAATGP